MKRTNKIISILLAITITLLSVFALAGCNGGLPENENGYVTLVIEGKTENTEYVVDLDKVTVTEGLCSVIDFLTETEGLTQDKVESTYGAYYNAIGEVVADASGYVSLFTSVESDFDVSSYAVTFEYEGVTLTSSGVGASSMKIEDGATYYVKYVAF